MRNWTILGLEDLSDDFGCCEPCIRLRRRSAGDWQLVSSLPNGILKL